MQLLKKSTAQLEIQDQRRRRIDDGVQIAQKVDSLRETLASLETQHQKFLDRVEGELQTRTQPLIQKIASLQSEIKELEEKRKELRVPLDKEWEEVRAKEAKVNHSEEALEKRNVNLSQKEEGIISLKTELKARLFKVKTSERELVKVRNLADENLYISEEKRDEALKQKKEADDYAKHVTQNLLTTEAELMVKARELEMRESVIEARQKEQDEREIWLVDRYQTLERNLNRK